MAPATLETVNPIRKMRGGAQAHLVEANDGSFYVIKFQNNPQHRRILINEIVCATFLQHLGIPAAPGRPILVTPEFCRRFPQVNIETAGQTRAPAPTPGWHFGSLFPGDPATLAVYDYLPDSQLKEIPDLGVFRGALVFDRWVGNADSRQTIFFREPNDPQLKVWLIDHGYAFHGEAWQLLDMPGQPLYHRGVVYQGISSLSDFSPWLDRIRHLPEQALDLALKAIPSQWLEQDEPALEELMLRLLARRKRLDQLIENSIAFRPSFFPDW